MKAILCAVAVACLAAVFGLCETAPAAPVTSGDVCLLSEQVISQPDQPTGRAKNGGRTSYSMRLTRKVQN